ncbi:hypothetical protein bmLB2001_001112 (plasmid) [Borrelia miyamotoi]|uniref:Lipoprotein n=1 Tax=Borrelia miyamotoi TaxID=47466 RepID=A0AAQ2WVY2_9SPIR|nr:hypothetical protein [Borrelia miyamotoi]AJA67233.1 hypothetical protein I871_B08 [Borrelia miyamotoi LB-2001]AOW96313.1 hypothetical protein AXH25_04595 [Borrelia miyamotoi]QTL84137.1 hypothetical protein bmLB2001_001112 [Borrelia miyamotoi]WAZ91569.1 hypothetical protein O5398_05390 [Borrelia miyamotoi]
MRYSFFSFVLFFFACQTLSVDEFLDKKLEKIERADHFLYFYPNSQIYIRRDKLTNNFSVFLNVVLDSKLNFDGGFLRLIQDDTYIGNINISKVVSIGNFRFLYVNIDKNNAGLLIKALNPYKRLSFVLDDDSYQVWTRGTFKYDAKFVDVDFDSTKDTLKYALENSIL